MFAESYPKRFTLAKQADVSFAERELVFTQTDHSARAPDVNGAESGLIIIFVTGEEVEDVVLARIGTGLERGPGYGRDRGNGRRQWFEAALLPQFCQIRQFAVCEELFGKTVIHAVEAENYAFFYFASRESVPAADGPDQIADGPGEQGQKRREQGREDSEE